MSEVEANTSRYWAYSNYLIALERLLRQLYPSAEALVEKMAASAGFAKIRRRQVARDRIAELLRNSWFTELLLAHSVEHQDLLPYATPWGMIQSYYAIYLALRAYFHAFGRAVDPAHQITLRTIGDDMAHNKGRFPRPWSTLLSGDPTGKPVHLINGPQRTPITLTNPLASPHRTNPWQHYGLFLKTTRRRQVDRAVRRWKKSNKRQVIRAPEREALIAQQRPTTLFDGLYRLRARANYQDIDSFALSRVEPGEAVEIQRALCETVSRSLLVFELLIARSAGKTWFGQVVKSLSKVSPDHPTADTVGLRWELIRRSF